MADTPSAGFGDLAALFGNNPFSGLTKSFQQFQRGTEQLMTTMENLNETLEQLNEVSVRITRMLDLLEEPARVLIPQVTRTMRAADDLVERMSAPIEKVVPGLTRLADALSTPALSSMPTDLNDFLGTLRDLSKRLQPLGQMAEAAGGMFSRSPFAAFLPNQGRTDAAPAATVAARPPAEPTPPPAPLAEIAAAERRRSQQARRPEEGRVDAQAAPRRRSRPPRSRRRRSRPPRAEPDGAARRAVSAWRRTGWRRPARRALRRARRR